MNTEKPSPPSARLDAAAIAELIRTGKRKELVFAILGVFCLAIAILTLTAAFLSLLLDGWSRIRPEFFVNFPSRRAAEAGILSAWVGSFMVLIVTMVAAVPLGVGAAIYLEEYGQKGGWIKDVIEINVTNLAGVPSIIYGLLALGLFVYYFKFGQSVLSAGLTLALLILPIVIVATREALRSVPVHIREAAYGVGATRWQMVSQHLVPYSAGGILTGIIIGLARAIGETAPVITIGALTFIAFLPPSPISTEPPFLNFDWLFSPFTVLPIQMFNWVSRPDSSFHASAAGAGLVLLAMCLAMNALAIYIRYQVRKKIKW